MVHDLHPSSYSTWSSASAFFFCSGRSIFLVSMMSENDIDRLRDPSCAKSDKPKFLGAIDIDLSPVDDDDAFSSARTRRRKPSRSDGFQHGARRSADDDDDDDALPLVLAASRSLSSINSRVFSLDISPLVASRLGTPRGKMKSSSGLSDTNARLCVCVCIPKHKEQQKPQTLRGAWFKRLLLLRVVVVVVVARIVFEARASLGSIFFPPFWCYGLGFYFECERVLKSQGRDSEAGSFCCRCARRYLNVDGLCFVLHPTPLCYC